MLVDTSILVPVFRDRSGERRAKFKRLTRGAEYVLTRFTQLELLRGCSSEAQWETLNNYLDGQDYVEARPSTWPDAARIDFDLRRRGLTVNSMLDCCIAQLAIDHRITLLHNDGDFETIAKVRNYRQRRFDLQG